MCLISERKLAGCCGLTEATRRSFWVETPFDFFQSECDSGSIQPFHPKFRPVKGKCSFFISLSSGVLHCQS